MHYSKNFVQSLKEEKMTDESSETGKFRGQKFRGRSSEVPGTSMIVFVKPLLLERLIFSILGFFGSPELLALST